MNTETMAMMSIPIDYMRIANEFPQKPEWDKVVEWSPEDNCYVGRIEGPLGPCCHGDDPEAVHRELVEIEDEWRALLGLPAAIRARIAEDAGSKQSDLPVRLLGNQP